jgi:acyl-CoA thioesterase FadM
MDCAYQGLLRRSGLSQRKLRSELSALGTPLLEATARFLAPATYDKALSVQAEVTKWGNTSFAISYRGICDGQNVFEGRESRVWVVPAKGPADVPCERVQGGA